MTKRIGRPPRNNKRKYPRLWINRMQRYVNPRAIVCARFARSWTQQDLADYLGVSHDAVQRWEHGKNFATHQNSDRLALWIQRTNREIRLNQLTPPPGYDELLRRTKDAIDA